MQRVGDRNTLEQKNNEIINKIRNDQESIRKYKINKSQDKNLKISNFIDENFNEDNINNEQYKILLRIFRANNLGDYNSLIRIINNNYQTYPILNILINHIDEIKELSCLLPIVQFSNYMLSKTFQKISRIQAKQTTIQDIIKEDNHGMDLFNKFQKSWEHIGKNINRKDCHQLPEIHNITLHHPVSIVLVGEKEQDEKYIPAALEYLGSIQNRLLDKISQNENYTEYYLQEKETINIQNITGDEILMYNTNTNEIDEITNYLTNYHFIYIQIEH
jgi:hypothetical protein